MNSAVNSAPTSAPKRAANRARWSSVSTLVALLFVAGTGCAGTGSTALAPSIEQVRARALAHPTDAPAQRALALAEMFADGGEPAEVDAALQRALALSRTDGTLLLAQGLQLDAHGEPEGAMAAYLAALHVLPGSRAPEAPHLTELTLQALAGLEGGVPGYRGRVEAAVRRALPALAAPARYLAGSLLMQLAYRRGDRQGAQAIARRLGCVTEVRAAGPFGPRDMLGFDADHGVRTGAPLAASYDLGPGRGEWPTRLLGARGCHVHLGGDPLGRGGTRYVQGYVEVAEAGRYVVTLDTPNSAELQVDGQRALRVDRRRKLGARVVFLPMELGPGRHELSLKVSSRHPNPVVALSVARLGSRDLAAIELPHAGAAATAGFAMYVRATVAMSRGDVLEARRVLDAAHLHPRTSALLLAQRANVALIDPLAPEEVRTGDARRLLVTALQKDRKLWNPAVQLAGLIANGGRVKEAVAALRDAVARWPRVPAIALSLAELLRTKGWNEEADRVLLGVRRLVPEACGPLQAEQGMWARRGRQARADALVPEIMACNAQSNARSALLRRRRHWQEADVELRRLQALEPPQSRYAWWLARMDVARERGDAATVSRLLARLRRAYPLAQSPAVEQLDGLLAQGAEAAARAVAKQALAAQPAAMVDLHRLLPVLGESHVMAPYRRDGQAAIAAYEASGATYEQPQVLVLDYMAVRVFADGSSLELVHTVQRAQSDEAVDQLAEVQVPEGAQVLKLHTIKADGEVLEADAIAGKDSVSLPAMAVGDYVEFEYLQHQPPVDGFPGGYLGERFYFRSFEVPFAHSELVAVLPAGMEVQFDPRGQAPPMKRQVRGDTQVLSWLVEQSPALVAEPGAVATSEYIPSVRFAVGTGYPDFVSSIREVLVDRDLYDPAVAEMVRDIVGDAAPGDHALRARRLYSWVLENIENNKDVFSQAAVMLRAHTGSRARILHYLLGLAGVPSTLALARSFGADQTPSEVPDSGAYDFLMLRVGEGPGAAWLYTVERGAPYGYVPALLRGQPALLLVPGAERDTVRDASGEGADRRALSLDVAMHADGSATIAVVEQVRGGGAVAWRGQLESVAEADLKRRFEEEYVARLIPGARLSELSIEGRDTGGEGLVFRYTIDVDVLGRAVEGGWAIPRLLGMHLASNYAQLSTRTTTQLVAAALDTEVTMRISVPDAASPPEAPPAASLRGPGGHAHFEQQARLQDGVLVLHRSARIPPHRVAVEDYPAFARFCREVDAVEARELVFRTGK